MLDARFLVLAVPVEYRYKSGARTAKEPRCAKTYSVVEAIYGSPRLSLPFEGPAADRLLARRDCPAFDTKPDGYGLSG
jgi:hypothetical protein